MATTTAEIQVTPYDIFTSAAAGIYPAGFNPTGSVAAGLCRLGTAVRTRDGRVFRFGRAGAVATVAGSLYQASVPVPNHLGLTPSAAAIGAKTVTATLGATAATANQYAEGWLYVSGTPGNGYAYGISSHPAIGSGAAGVITLNNDDALQIAITGSSLVGLMANPYADVVVTPTTKTAVCIGVPLCVIPAGYYGWFQTWGPCPVLVNGTPAVTAPVINSATTAGAVDVWTAAAQPTAQLIGQMMQVGVSGQNNMVFLTIAS